MAQAYEWARKRLQAELRRLQSEMEQLQQVERDRPFAASDAADISVQFAAAEEKRRRRAVLQARLERVEAALRRLAKNSFGRCEVCGGQIETARLHLMPVATQCCRCQTTSERRQLLRDGLRA